MDQALLEEFNKGRDVTISAENMNLWDHTVEEMRDKVNQFRVFKNEYNPSVCYWLGRIRGKIELRRQRCQPMSAEIAQEAKMIATRVSDIAMHSNL